MTLQPTASRISGRITAAGLSAASDLADRLAAYYDLLQRWNAKINLTALDDSDEAIDRLVVEPLAAAAVLPRGAHLLDVGSGGGSPAIPLALALGASRLTMIESRTRKTAFLREAVRTLELPASVEADRAEALAARGDFAGAADVVSLRAVRITAELAKSIRLLLKPAGELALFGRAGDPVPPGFTRFRSHVLIPPGTAVLHVFHVEPLETLP